jgi:pimeloyl-ACP methyl ester carboxylesterase
MTQAGYRVMTMDHPGTATNPLPKGHPFLTPRKSASYIARALKIWRSGAPLFGVGHSMGGMMSTLVQAQSREFSGMALLGASAGGLDWGLTEAERKYIENPAAFARDLERLTLAKFKTPFPEGMGGPSGKSITFGGESEALTSSLRNISCKLFAAGGMMSMTRGSFRREVEAIDVPMFFAFGDHDIGIAPEDAPRDYINAKGIKLLVLKSTGHNHFAFSSIHTLSRELDYWASSLL